MLRKPYVASFYEAIENICKERGLEKPYLMEFHFEDNADVEIYMSDIFLAQFDSNELRLLKRYLK